MKHLQFVLAVAALTLSPILTAAPGVKPAAIAGLTTSPSSPAFTAPAGSTTRVFRSLSVNVSSAASYTVRATGKIGANTWLFVTPSGPLTGPQTLSVSIYPRGLMPATYHGTIAITSAGQTLSVPVTLTITSPAAATAVSPVAQ